jgi:hypothetical protein
VEVENGAKGEYNPENIEKWKNEGKYRDQSKRTEPEAR